MKYIILMLLPLIIFFGAYGETKLPTLHTQRTQSSNSFVKKALESHVKPAIAGTSMAAGTHLLYDAIKTTFDMQSSPQRNTQKGITLNAILGAGFLFAGAYFFKYIWDDKSEEQNQIKQ